MIAFIENTLTAKGFQFDVAVFDTNASPRLNLTAQLWKPDGSGRYRGYFM